MGQDAVIPGPLDKHGYRDDDGYMVWFVGGKAPGWCGNDVSCVATTVSLMGWINTVRGWVLIGRHYRTFIWRGLIL